LALPAARHKLVIPPISLNPKGWADFIARGNYVQKQGASLSAQELTPVQKPPSVLTRRVPPPGRVGFPWGPGTLKFLAPFPNLPTKKRTKDKEDFEKLYEPLFHQKGQKAS
jgi:hypothetical protein